MRPYQYLEEDVSSDRESSAIQVKTTPVDKVKLKDLKTNKVKSNE